MFNKEAVQKLVVRMGRNEPNSLPGFLSGLVPHPARASSEKIAASGRPPLPGHSRSSPATLAPPQLGHSRSSPTMTTPQQQRPRVAPHSDQSEADASSAVAKLRSGDYGECSTPAPRHWTRKPPSLEMLARVLFEKSRRTKLITSVFCVFVRNVEISVTRKRGTRPSSAPVRKGGHDRRRTDGRVEYGRASRSLTELSGSTRSRRPTSAPARRGQSRGCSVNLQDRGHAQANTSKHERSCDRPLVSGAHLKHATRISPWHCALRLLSVHLTLCVRRIYAHL